MLSLVRISPRTSCKDTNKRAKYKRKTRFSFYFRAKVSKTKSKIAKSLGIKTHLGEKTAKKLEISEKVLIFEMEFRRYFHSKLKINRDLFCSLLAYSYLCSVKGEAK